MSVIRVLIADDHRIVRQGLRHVCELAGGLTVAGEAENGREAVKLAQQFWTVCRRPVLSSKPIQRRE
jgi:YesN/AraC family two-component response regulator